MWPLIEQHLSKTGNMSIEGCPKNICWIMSERIDLNVEGGKQGQENLVGALHYLRQRKERVDHTGHKKTPTTRESPFIVHNTSLFIHLSISVHFVYSKSTNCYRGTWQGFAKKKKDICRLVSNPSHHIQTGEGKRQDTSIREKGSIAATSCITGHLQCGLLKGRQKWQAWESVSSHNLINVVYQWLVGHLKWWVFNLNTFGTVL